MSGTTQYRGLLMLMMLLLLKKENLPREVLLQ